MKLRALPLLCSLAVVSLGTTAHAVVIPVPNASFESPVLADGTSSAPITGWTATGSNFLAPAYNPVNANYAGATGGNLPGTANGAQAADIFTGGAGGGTLTTTAPVTTFLANTTYTLTVAIGARLDYSNGQGMSIHGAVISLLGNGGMTAGSLTFDTTTLTKGTFADFTTTFTTGASGGLVGQGLWISLGTFSEGSMAIDFDNVRLTDSNVAVGGNVPDAGSTAALLGLSLVGLFGLRRKFAAAKN